MKIIYSSYDIAEFSMVQSILRSAGIEFIDSGSMAYGKRSIDLTISVEDEDEADARAILEDYFKSTTGCPENDMVSHPYTKAFWTNIFLALAGIFAFIPTRKKKVNKEDK